jgi:hypothetical protein
VNAIKLRKPLRDISNKLKDLFFNKRPSDASSDKSNDSLKELKLKIKNEKWVS